MILKETVSISFLLNQAFSDFDKRNIEFQEYGKIVEYDDNMNQRQVGNWSIALNTPEILYEINE